jgi:hypothetical protein
MLDQLTSPLAERYAETFLPVSVEDSLAFIKKTHVKVSLLGKTDRKFIDIISKKTK